MNLLTHLPPGWVAIEEAELERFEDEYAAEIAKGHPLYGVPVRAMARSQDGKEVLFRVLRHLCDYVIVLLTWSGCEEIPDTPHYDLFTDDADLISELARRKGGRH
jgi:hypothetical protein